MVRLLFILVALLVISCADKGKGVVKENSSVSKQLDTLTVNDAIGKEFTKIATYNFKALEERYLAKENDTTYILNFWATWCKPCIKELPAFETVNKKYKDEKVKVVLVSLDFPEKLKSLVIPFIDMKNIQSSVVLLDDPDANTWIPKVSDLWSGAIPATIITKNGQQNFHEGTLTLEQLETQIQNIL